MYVDPTGYGWWSKFWKAIAAVAIVVATAVIGIVQPQLQPFLWPVLLSQMTCMTTGGISAAVRGGDVGEGMLFGAIAGTGAGLALGAMGPALSTAKDSAAVFGAMAEGAIAGTAAGATAGYAGGKGSIQDTVFWAAIGNVSTAVLNGIGASLKAANPSKHVVNKCNARAVKPPSPSTNKLDFEIKKISGNLRVDESFNIALSDAEETAFDILSYTADAVQPGSGVAVEVGRRAADFSGLIAENMAKETADIIVDSVYGTQDAVRKFEEINTDPAKSFTFIKRVLGIHK